MAEHLRNALRDFALQKMRDLEAERTTKSKKDDDSAGKTRKSTKIKINRDISKAISGSSKKPEEPQLVASDSKKSTKRHHEESATGDEKITKLMKLYKEDATAELLNAAEKEESVSVKSHSEQSESQRSADGPLVSGQSVQEQDGMKTVKHSGWTVVKGESSQAKPQFKSLSSVKKPESDAGDGTEKKSIPVLGDKKTIQIKIQTKLLALPQEPEKEETKRSDSESDSSNDDESDDSDDENMIIDGLPWRTILEDGELTPSTSEEENKAEEDGDGVKDIGEVKGEGGEKIIKDKEEEVLDNTGETKKKSSKHKHKSKHKKHKHKSKKKKKSKHKHKDKKEKDSTSDAHKDGSTSFEKKTNEVKDPGVSASETRDIKDKRDKSSSSRRRSKDEKPKEKVLEDRKVHRSSSASRKTSEEREARGSTQENVTKEDAKKNKGTEERKEKPRSHSKSRSSSKEKSHTKEVEEEKVTIREKIREKMTEEKYRSKSSKEEVERHKEKPRQSQERKTERQVSDSERGKDPMKSDDDKKCVPSSEKLGGGDTCSKDKNTVLPIKEEPNDPEYNVQTNLTKLLLEKEKTVKTEAKDESRTVTEGIMCTITKTGVAVPKDFSITKTHADKNEKQTHEERNIKEEKILKDDTRKTSRREEEKKDDEKEKSRREESRRREKRHREKGKDKEDKKHHSSKKHPVTSKVKIDHLEHDFPSAEEYAEDLGDKVQTETKGDVNSKLKVSDQANTSGIQAIPSEPPAVAESLLDDASTEHAGKGREKVKEERTLVEDTKTLKEATSATNINPSSTNVAKSEKSKVMQEEVACHKAVDTKIADSVSSGSAKQKEHIGDTKESSATAKELEGSSGKSEDASKLGRETIGGVESLKTNEIKKEKLPADSESAGGGNNAKDIKEDAPSSDKNEKGAVGTTSADANPAKTSEKKVESKVAEKGTDKESKKRKKDKSDVKEEGALDSEIEEGEITKRHKKSKKKDKKKDRKEKDKKDRTDRDKSEHRDRDKRSKRRHSDSRSESRSHSRSSQKKHKGSRSKSPSDGDGDSDISIGKTEMVEKSFFSESRGCWVTQMVPKEEHRSSSSGNDDGNEPYDIGDTYIRYPPHDRRSVFDRLGGGSSGARGSSSRERFNERYDRRAGYGYRRRRGRSYSRSRSRSRSKSPSFRIDKKKLLEIAKANALQRMRAGDLPANLPIPDSMKKAADTFEVNESIQKFTERCKALANLQGGSSDDDSPVNRPIGSDDEDDEAQKTFVRHPFKVKESAPIVMNIRNAVQIPVAGKEKLRTQFPVSSGSQHRRKEEEIIIANANDPYGQWTTVEKKQPEPEVAPSTTKASTPQPPPPPATAPPTTTTTPTTAATAPAPTTTAVAPVVAGPHIPGVTNVQPPQPVPEKDKVFEDAPGFAYDIGQIVSARLKAARSLQSNPHNVEALTVLHHSQKQIQTWAHSSKKPGLFTGSTDATFLRPEQLGNPNRKNQAWIKKDMFLTAAPVNTDIGRSLMHKMGWKQGEGLGKNSEGAVNPLLLEIKTDRQGLVAAEEKPKKKGDVSKVIRKDLSGKHPVMALNELCNKKRWGKPIFEVVREDGLAHKKNFVFKVRIRNEEYIPTVTSGNKKDAKAMAATVALQKMGLLLT